MTDLINRLARLGDAKNHGPVDPRKLEDILNKTLEARNTARFRRKQSFSPSTVGYGHGTCPRYWYIAFDGAVFVEENTAKGIANMDNGQYVHDRIGKLFKESPLDIIAIEQELTTQDPPVRGFIDVILNRAGESIVGEFKSARTESFTARRMANSPTPGHLVQVLMYMYLTDIQHGFVLYEDKNTNEIAVLPMALDDHKEYVEYLITWLRSTRKVWEEATWIDDSKEHHFSNRDASTMPKRPFRKNARQCKTCPVRDVCFSRAEEGDVNLEALRLPTV
jgi:CRISPR/Cas system-associated exonuclease Cas4 (RecB family)